MLLAWKGLFRSTNDILPACLAACAHQTTNKIWGMPKAPFCVVATLLGTLTQVCILQFNLQQSSVMHSTLAHVGPETSKCTDYPRCIPVSITTQVTAVANASPTQVNSVVHEASTEQCFMMVYNAGCKLTPHWCTLRCQLVFSTRQTLTCERKSKVAISVENDHQGGVEITPFDVGYKLGA